MPTPRLCHDVKTTMLPISSARYGGGPFGLHPPGYASGPARPALAREPEIAWAASGFGIGICQSALAARDKAIIRVLKARFSLAMDTWVAMHEDLRESPRCAVTLAALAVGLSAHLRRP
jgi:hypothetical protein